MTHICMLLFACILLMTGPVLAGSVVLEDPTGDDDGPGSYTYVEHRKYLFALLEELGVKENVTLVIHDWGSGLGFHWAHQNPHALKGISGNLAMATMVRITAPSQLKASTAWLWNMRGLLRGSPCLTHPI